MKKLLLALPVLAVSMAASAQPYVTLGYGYNSLSHDNTVSFSDGTNLKPDSAESVAKAALGYRFENNLGVEVGYSQFDADASKSKTVSVVGTTVTEDEWDADFKAKQLTIKPVYFFDVTENLSIKGGLGLTYTDYKMSGSSQRETENEVTDVESSTAIPGVTNPASKSQKELGVTASIGAEYRVYQGLFLGAEASFNHDSVANASQVLGTVTYRF